MLTFKQFLAEMRVTRSGSGNPISSRVYDPDTGNIDARSKRHLERDVLPHGADRPGPKASKEERAVYKEQRNAHVNNVIRQLTTPGSNGIDITPTHSHSVEGSDRHVAVVGLSVDTVGGSSHYHAYVKPVTDQGDVVMSAPEERIQLSKLSKPRPVKNTLRAEDEMLSGLNKRIEAVKERHALTHVPIVVGGRSYYVSRFSSTPGTPKSDVFSIHGETADPNNTLHLSLKAGKHPRDVQQYGGITAPRIKDHPEVRAFAKDIFHSSGGGLVSGQHFNRPIVDPHLKSMMVFGHDYGSPHFGKNNVQAFVQGDIKIIPHPTLPDHWTLDAAHIIHNHESVEGDHEPVLAARYQSDRHTRIPEAIKLGINDINQKGVALLTHSRIGAFPRAGLPLKSQTI